MKRNFFWCCLGLIVLAATSLPAQAQLSGAIFTTDVNGAEVNANTYASKDLVYLDGGPGPGAPQGAAGLPDGTYVFQVTDPSGKTLLSIDIALCRQFTVAAGIITGVVNVGGCQHATGLDQDHGAATVQLIPFLDTPNNGGEYKAWATPVADYVLGCDTLGIAPGTELNTVDCGLTGGLFHGFIPGFSKTDNFKVKSTQQAREIDTKFWDSNLNLIVGEGITWIDTLSVSNPRYSEVNPNIGNPGLAHVENVETGVHYIVINSQPGCTVSRIILRHFIGKDKSVDIATFNGPATVPVTVKANFSGTITLDVSCN
jgi:hypothetical protein